MSGTSWAGADSAGSAISASATSNQSRPLVGAIRWDGWQENGGVQAGLEKALGPSHWYYRLPFFAKITGSNSVVINGNTQAIMDQEINYAADAGIDYWAFDIYPDDSGMSQGLHLYLNSPIKNRINFALNLQGGWIATGSEDWNTQVARFVKYFKAPSYQKVLGNRPLVFLFGQVKNTPRFPNAAAVAAAIKHLRAATTNAGLGNPYIVFQGWNAIDDFNTMQDYGLDAIGAYAVGGGKPYTSLAAHAHQFWEQGKATGANVVPIVGSGWDNRPFQETPTAWYPEPTTGNYTLPPKPAELANHLADALAWTERNRTSATPANVVLIYAWNEHAEGGWICPTLNSDGSPNAERLNAIAAKLKSEADRAGMGVERVARLFTPVYQSKAAQDDNETLWVQVDLGAERKIDAVKLLPMVVWWTGKSQGFPARFKIEVSNDPRFGTSNLIADRSKEDFPDPNDVVGTFPAGGKQGRYVRLTASRMRQKQLALTKLIVLSAGKDVAEGGRVADSKSGDPEASVLTRPPRPQGEYVVTDNPGNVIPPAQWKPVAYQAWSPQSGVRLDDGLFKKVMADNIGYLLTSVSMDEMVRHFLMRAGKPSQPLPEARQHSMWFNKLPGSEAGRFLMGAGNTLRWLEQPELRARMDRIVDVIDECKEPDGFIMGYPREESFVGENGAYVRSWVTQGLIAAGYAGNPKAFPLLRGYYDWFNHSCYLPELLRRGAQGVQGIIPCTSMYFTPVGQPDDLRVVQRYFQENYWMKQLAGREEKAIWLYPYDRPHNYLITAIEPYLDLYRATGAKPYLDAAAGGWDLYRDHWEHVGGSIAICEGTDLYPPDSYALRRETGELCGSVFWVKLNQRFHLLDPGQEKYVAEIEKSIYNVAIANQIGSKGIRYHARLVDYKDPSHEPYSHCMNTCCEGQGTRLFGSLPEYVYSLADDGLYVNLFAASEITFTNQGTALSLKTTTQFPFDPKVQLEVKTAQPVQAKIRIRIPSWATTKMPVLVNAHEMALGKPGTYLTLDRKWKNNDVISFTLPMGFRTTCYRGAQKEFNDGCHYALEYGPFLMALVGQSDRKDDFTVHVNPKQLPQSLRAVPGKPLHFTVTGDERVEYLPYWEVQNEPFTSFPLVKSEKP